MSRIISVTKAYSYESAPFKTPNIKEIAPAPSSYDHTKETTPHPPILMDEYGQTPDHYYLARKPPPSFFQVKRKLDLQSIGSPKNDNAKGNKSRQKRKISLTEKVRGKTIIEKPRYDTSLGQLTKKFLKLLSDAENGIVNLNTACSLLSVPKRRLYDITNVLEGAGLIQKTSRNNIQWMGKVTSPCENNANDEKEIDLLEAKENKLDELIYHMQSQIKNHVEKNSQFNYVTSEDLKSIAEFSQKTLIGIKTSPSVQVVETNEKTVVITSTSNEIEAYVLREDVSFSKILQSNAVFQQDSYQVKIKNKNLDDKLDSLSTESPCKTLCLIGNESPNGSCEDMIYNQICSGTVWTQGDTVIKNAFITEEDDIAPLGRNFLLQTEDQDVDSPLFSFLESTVDNYSFSLDDGEGLTDLFDCSFSCP